MSREFWATEYMAVKTASLPNKEAGFWGGVFNLAKGSGKMDAPLSPAQKGPSVGQAAASQALNQYFPKPAPAPLTPAVKSTMTAAAGTPPAAPKPVPMRPAGVPADNPLSRQRKLINAKAQPPKAAG